MMSRIAGIGLRRGSVMKIGDMQTIGGWKIRLTKA